jgi:hypothetical protein
MRPNRESWPKPIVAIAIVLHASHQVADAAGGPGLLQRMGRLLKEKAAGDFERFFQGTTKTRERLGVRERPPPSQLAMEASWALEQRMLACGGAPHALQEHMHAPWSYMHQGREGLPCIRASRGLSRMHANLCCAPS